jgi:hypothetical protein
MPPPKVVPVLFPDPHYSYERRSLSLSVCQHFEYAMGCIFLRDEGVSTQRFRKVLCSRIAAR